MRSRTIAPTPRQNQAPLPTCDNLPRALPVLAVVVDGAAVDSFDNEGWRYQFDPDSEILHCQVLTAAEREFSRHSENITALRFPSARSPDGKILYCLNNDLELEITDLVEGKIWKSKLPDLRVHPDAHVRLTMSKTGDQFFIHASESNYLNRSQAEPTLFVFDTNRTPLRKPIPTFDSTPHKAQKKRKKKGLFEKVFDKIIEKII